MQTTKPAVSKYRKLVEDISTIYEELRQKTVEAYWNIGKRIVEIEQDGEIRAEYGERLIQELSKELCAKFGAGFSERNLANMRRFYLSQPILQTSAKLTWSHYVSLISVEDEVERKALEKRAEKEDLSARELEDLARRSNLSSEKSSKSVKDLKFPTGLQMGTCRLSDKEGEDIPDDHTMLDLGFYVHKAIPRKLLGQVEIKDKPTYTYVGVIDRVIDGDTLIIDIRLGFYVISSQRVRLRWINAPEIDTPAGEEAKKFLTALLPKGKHVVLKSHLTDIYGRFLADVFFLPDNGPDSEILSRGVYLNQEILSRGFAKLLEE